MPADVLTPGPVTPALPAGAALLDLPGEIVGGHPDRHVRRVLLGEVPAYLKVEHRVRWRDRLRNALAGFGWVSKSRREADVLTALERAGLPAPRVLAVTADGRGRTGLLVRAVEGACELRRFLAGGVLPSATERRRFARQLGRTLAAVHAAGFSHPDLSVKHVLVDLDTHAATLFDWQRGRVGVSWSWRRSVRALALLNATLADRLASPLDRWACLRAYLRAGRPEWDARTFGRAVFARTRILLGRRSVREAHQPPLAERAQALHWLDGEALCVTPTLATLLDGPALDRLAYDSGERSGGPDGITVVLPGGREARLVRRRGWFVGGRLLAALRRREWRSPEMRQARLLFHLQKYGLPALRVLAFGQRPARFGRSASFLLTEAPRGVPATCWLTGANGTVRRSVLRRAGELVRRLHDAGCHPDGTNAAVAELFRVAVDAVGRPTLRLGTSDGLRTHRRPRPALVRRDLRQLRDAFASFRLTRTDGLRFLLAYLRTPRLTDEAKRLARSLAPTRKATHA